MATGTVSDEPYPEETYLGPCFVCGRDLEDHSWRERRRCDRTPINMFAPTPPSRRRWWRWSR